MHLGLADRTLPHWRKPVSASAVFFTTTVSSFSRGAKEKDAAKGNSLSNGDNLDLHYERIGREPFSPQFQADRRRSQSFPIRFQSNNTCQLKTSHDIKFKSMEGPIGSRPCATENSMGLIYHGTTLGLDDAVVKRVPPLYLIIFCFDYSHSSYFPCKQKSTSSSFVLVIPGCRKEP